MIAGTATTADTMPVIAALAAVVSVARTEVLLVGTSAAVGGTVAGTLVVGRWIGIALGGVVALAAFAYSLWCAYRADGRFSTVRRFGVAVAALNGTNFCGADLTEAVFARASLANVDFHEAILTHVRWSGARELMRARISDPIAAPHQVRQLLVTGEGADGNWQHCDLRGVDLRRANLSSANLKGANLAHARLHGANLENANLTTCCAVGADFTGAKLTGACIQAWNTDKTTILRDVECSHVFLREVADERGVRERRPYDPNRDFAPGDFEKFFAELTESIEILFRYGLNPDALREVCRTADTQGLGLLRLVGLRQVGEDVIVTLEVQTDADKAQLERTLRADYDRRVRALGTPARGLLVAPGGSSALAALLEELFSSDELRRWVHQHIGSQAHRELPEGVSLAELAFQAALIVERQGRIGDAFWAALVRERPHQSERIRMLAKLWSDEGRLAPP
ncbi:pentapeptide repeat-containing protein [Haliangium sp.]|uniref:pentapeptide repeat-containing protein n=1 Tax=Haliangium sp. TaxID=2663208 RepID=UPI003D13CE7A